MRWGEGELTEVEASGEIAACFVFVLQDRSAAPRAVTLDNPFGSVGWMSVVAPAELRELHGLTPGPAFRLVVEMSQELVHELFEGNPREHLARDMADFANAADKEIGPLCFPLTPAARLAAESVRRCPLAGPCRGLVLAARCHDLLAEFLAASRSQAGQTATLMSDTETRIRAAGGVLGRSLEQAPSLEMLAREVGLSETTLKRGFHQVYGTTVFGHLRALRMEHARALLQSGQATVIEAATQVGYSNPSNFASAFRAQFGLNPKEFQLAARR